MLVSSKPLGGTNPAHDLIARNFAFGNVPADIHWDGTGGQNRFKGNRCDTSQPSGFCT